MLDTPSFARAARIVPTSRITQERALFDIVYANIGTSLTLNIASTYVANLRHALHVGHVAGALGTGPTALEHDCAPALLPLMRVRGARPEGPRGLLYGRRCSAVSGRGSPNASLPVRRR